MAPSSLARNADGEIRVVFSLTFEACVSSHDGVVLKKIGPVGKLTPLAVPPDAADFPQTRASYLSEYKYNATIVPLQWRRDSGEKSPRRGRTHAQGEYCEMGL